MQKRIFAGKLSDDFSGFVDTCGTGKRNKRIGKQVNFGLSFRQCRGSEVTVGSEDQLQNLVKGIFVQEGSSRTRFDHGQNILCFSFQEQLK